MSERPPIEALLETNRYNIEFIPQLEDYVNQQLQTRTYHFLANQTLLNLYQRQPEKIKLEIVTAILIKALMNLHNNNDFMLSLYLLPEKLHGEEIIERLIELANLLETGLFQEFWRRLSTWNSLLQKFNETPGFVDAIRGFILGILTRTYLTISKQFLSEVLNLSGTELEAFVADKDWKQTDVSVTFPQEFQPKPVRVVENIRFEQLGKILQTLK
eukprot:TRINITY_DN141_c0_g1_i1.p1 TRINITY_DN141_c0_g1~~TRINITY_DN141_c0_g1_i1.p1  ORF type:complete len:215 (+),score=31.75 TRINITY_DN141_c0_g1_i1:100-744(+)